MLGGGAKVTEPAGIRRVRLTRLQPQKYNVIGDAFYVTAEAFDLARSHEWSVTAYAICAARSISHFPGPPYTVDPGLHAHGSIADGTYASDRCPAGFRTHGMGGGGITDGGPSWPREISPHYDLKGVAVRMTGPLVPSIGGMVAHQTCAAP